MGKIASNQFLNARYGGGYPPNEFHTKSQIVSGRGLTVTGSYANNQLVQENDIWKRINIVFDGPSPGTPGNVFWRTIDNSTLKHNIQIEYRQGNNDWTTKSISAGVSNGTVFYFTAYDPSNPGAMIGWSCRVNDFVRDNGVEYY